MSLNKIITAMVKRLRPGELLDIAMQTGMSVEEVEQTLKENSDVKHFSSSIYQKPIAQSSGNWVLGFESQDDEKPNVAYSFNSKEEALEYFKKYFLQEFDELDNQMAESIWENMKERIEDGLCQWNYHAINYTSDPMIVIYQKAIAPDLNPSTTMEDVRKFFEEEEEE